MTRGEMTHQQKIDQINKWVAEYKDGNMDAGDNLIIQFEPFLNSVTNRFMKYYAGVFSWDMAIQESRVIFLDLLNEYTIGGVAYFNVYIQRKLPLRLRYCFIKEIRRRTRDLSHSDEQFKNDGLDRIDDIDRYEEFDDNDEIGYMVAKVHQAMDECGLTDRERDMLLSYMDGEQHTMIAQRYGISRSRASRIIKKATEKIQEQITISGNVLKGDNK